MKNGIEQKTIMVLSFERGRKITDALEIGRSAAAFKVTEITLKLVVFSEGPTGSPNIGRYFRNDDETEYNIPLGMAYSFLQMVLKKKTAELRKLTSHILKEIDFRATAHFTFFFKGEPGELKPKDVIITPESNYHWRDLAGFDLIVDNKMLKLPEGRLLPNSDFQFCFDGEKYPATPSDTI